MMDRLACLERWRAASAGGSPILGAGAGTGISAKCAEAAGADLIIIYDSGRYRMAGRGSFAGLMPYGMQTRSCWRWAAKYCPSFVNASARGR